MKIVIGLLLVLAGIAFGAYVGVWLMFIGGIIQVVEALKSTPIESLGIAIGAARILFASFVGLISAYIGVIPGLVMIKSSL